MSNSEGINVDSLIPQDMAIKAEGVGVAKAGLGSDKLIGLGILAGGFIGLGAVFATTIAAGSSALPYGVARLLPGLVFSLGLILVVVGGAELFTGNTLIIMAWASKRISTGKLLRNWLYVYLSNFAGSVGLAVLIFLSGQYKFGGGAIGLTALNIAAGKMNFTFVEAVALGTLCNMLVCLAIWLSFSARSTTDRILAVLFPITAFVAAGFEHSVANMYFIPVGIFIKNFASPEFWSTISKTAADYANLTWGNFLVNNLLPVTIGNILGGAVLVGVMYWLIYLRKRA